MNSRPSLTAAPSTTAERVTISPSEFGDKWKDYQFSARGREPSYVCFRPPVAPPRALPASLVCKVFGEFIDAAQLPLSALGAYGEASECAVKLLASMPLAFENEAARQRVVLDALTALLGLRVEPASCGLGPSRPTTDGSVLQLLGTHQVTSLILEVKNEPGKQGDPFFQLQRHFDVVVQHERATVPRSLRGCTSKARD